jgi:mono/diheme cytochrome c family protein
MKFKLAVVALVGIAVAGGAFRAVSAQEKTQWDGVYTADQAKRGEMVFGDSCAVCHGADLGGSDLAPALTGGDFATNWNDMKIGDFFDRVSQTMPLSSPGSLSAQQYADVVSFILQKSGAPAGTTDLASTKDALSSIKFVAKKPGA